MLQVKHVPTRVCSAVSQLTTLVIICNEPIGNDGLSHRPVTPCTNTNRR